MTRLILAVTCMLLFLGGCSSNTIESESFEVRTQRDYIGRRIYIDSRPIGSSSMYGRRLSAERDDSLGVGFVSDSTLAVTDIDVGSTQHLSLLLDLTDNETPTLDLRGGVSFVADDTTRLSTLESGESAAATFQKNSRPDIFFITAYAPASPYPYGYLICLLGVKSTELVSVTDSTLVFDCMWIRQPSRQRFEVDLSDGILEPGDFKVVAGE